MGEKTKKRYDFWPFSSSSDDDDRSPSPNNACVLVAFFFLERLNARRRRARRHLCTNRSARAQRQKAVASCRRTRYGETPARRLGVLRETKDDRRFWVKDHCFIPLQKKEEVENRTIFYQKPPFKNERRERRKEKNKGRTDANNAAVVAAVTAALESFSDKLDAWTVLLTELCRKEKRERLVSARRRGLFAERHSSRPQKQRGQNIDDDGRRRKEAH